MRPQQQAILEAMSKGALKLDSPFLTHGDLLECASEVSQHLGGDPSRMSRSTVQAWVKGGVIRESNPDREIRNRLYSGLDLIRLATIFHISHVGISVHAASRFADAIEKELRTNFEQFDSELKLSPEIRPGEYLLASTMEGEWHLRKPDSVEVMNRSIQISGLTLVFNFNLLCRFSFAILGKKWKEKATALKDKMEAYLAKHPPKAARQPKS